MCSVRADSSLVDKPGNQPVHGGLTGFGKVWFWSSDDMSWKSWMSWMSWMSSMVLMSEMSWVTWFSWISWMF